MTVLAVSGLGVAIAGRTLVRDVTFDVAAGETLAIVGESGSGKSLTALALLNLLPPGAVRTGRVTVAGTEVDPAATTETSPALRRLRGGMAGMVFQEPMTSLNPLHRVGRQVAEAAALHGPAPTRDAVLAMLARAGFADAGSRLDAFPHQLSGGQRQRVMIAMALANNPSLLIADEPTTALDVTIQAQILDLLAAEKTARGLAMLIISHDLNLVRRVADRVCVMQGGAIMEQGPVDAVLAAPRDLPALLDEVRAMREKVRAAHRVKAGSFDLKHSPGGMIDVEFAVQALVLGHGAQRPELIDDVGNIALLQRAEAATLLPAGVGTAAADAYRELRRVQHRARLDEQPTQLQPEAMTAQSSAVLALWHAVFS